MSYVQRILCGMQSCRLLFPLVLLALVDTAWSQESGTIGPSPPSIETILSQWQRVHTDGDSLSYAVYIAEHVERADTAEVFFNVHGRPSAWRAVVGGTRYAHVPTVGLFVVDDSLAAASRVYATRRHLLEALELLHMIERRVRAAEP